jgi:hypothetical protein
MNMEKLSELLKGLKVFCPEFDNHLCARIVPAVAKIKPNIAVSQA